MDCCEAFDALRSSPQRVLAAVVTDVVAAVGVSR
jgi:hypothetical protein